MHPLEGQVVALLVYPQGNPVGSRLVRVLAVADRWLLLEPLSDDYEPRPPARWVSQDTIAALTPVTNAAALARTA